MTKKLKEPQQLNIAAHLSRVNPRLNTSMNYVPDERPEYFDRPTGPSMTVPDTLMSLREMVEKHTQGLPIPTFAPMYYDIDLPDLRKLDLTEIDELYDDIMTKRAKHQQDLDDAYEAAEEERIQRAVEARQKQAGAGDPPPTSPV